MGREGTRVTNREHKMNRTETNAAVMTSTTAHGRVRSLCLWAEGMNGSGEPAWMLYTTNPNGTIHNVARFASRSEAVAWMKWA